MTKFIRPAKSGFRAVTAGVFLLIGASRLCADGQVIVNGGFEDGAKGWWGGGMETGGVVGEQPADGGKCLKVTGDFVCQDKISITGKQRYKISMKIRADGAPDGSVYVQLSYRGGGVSADWRGPATASVDGREEKALFVTGGSHGWREFSVVVQSPEQADQMLVYLRKTPGSAGAAYFDNVRIEPTDAPATKDAPAQLPADGQVILNGGFEDGAKGWWGDGMKAGGVVEENPADGGKCLKVGGNFVCQDKRPVTEGKRYKISMKIRADNAPEGSVYVQLSYRGGGLRAEWFGPAAVELDGRKEKALFVTGGSHGWREFSTVVEAPKEAEQMLLYLRKKDGTDGAAYFDSVSMLPTDEAPVTAAELRRAELAKEWLQAPLPVEQARELLQKAVTVSGAAKGKLVLAENGAARYRVHVGSGEKLVALNAAHDLAEHLGKISGGDFLPLSHDLHPLAGPLIVVGRDNELAKKLLPDTRWEELGADGFVIVSAGPHIVIAGNTPGGTMYGVNWFLDHKLGVKWLSPDYTSVPLTKTIELAALKERQIPRFKFRQILSHEGQDKPFAARNLLNGNSHGAQAILPRPEIDHWDSSWQRPGLTGSFYQLMPGKDAQSGWYAGGQVAMMNPAVREFFADAIAGRLRGESKYQDYWFGFMDNDWGWDMDAKSAEFAKEHGGVPSAPRTDMAVDVAERVRKKLPGAKIAFNAYHWGFTPPTGLTVPAEVLVFPMTIHVDYSTPLNKGRNTQMGKDIAGWNDIAKTVLLWDHVTNFHGFTQPTPNIYPIAESIRWLSGLENVFGYFAEGSWNTRGAEFASLRVWLMGRMLWNPAADIDAAVGEYCDAYYGPAGKIIKQYIDLMHAEAQRTKAAVWEKTNVDSPLLNFDFITKADALMERAEAAAANDAEFSKHARRVRADVDYVVLLRRLEFENEAKKRGVSWSADTARRRARFDATVAWEKITEYRQGGKMDELASIMDIERKDAPAPLAVSGKEWREIQDLGFNRYYKPTVIVPDAAASDGAAARMEGKSDGWLIQLKRHLVPEEGEWEIYAEVRVDAEGAADDDTVLRIGSAPPMSCVTAIPYRQVKGGGYHVVQAPGGPFKYTGDDGKIVYITGVKDGKSQHVYVDRFFMVRVK